MRRLCLRVGIKQSSKKKKSLEDAMMNNDRAAAPESWYLMQVVDREALKMVRLNPDHHHQVLHMNLFSQLPAPGEDSGVFTVSCSVVLIAVTMLLDPEPSAES